MIWLVSDTHCACVCAFNVRFWVLRLSTAFSMEVDSAECSVLEDDCGAASWLLNGQAADLWGQEGFKHLCNICPAVCPD